MTRLLTAALLLLAACSRSTGGPLEPVEAEDVQLSKDADGDREARIQAGVVSARISARWSDTGGQSVVLVYTNRGPTTARIDLSSLAMSSPAGKAVIMSAADVTSIDLLDQRSDNDDARVVLRRDDNGTAIGGIDLPSGAERRVDAQLSPFSNTIPAASGSKVILHVPMPNAPRSVVFVAHQPSLLPF